MNFCHVNNLSYKDLILIHNGVEHSNTLVHMFEHIRCFLHLTNPSIKALSLRSKINIYDTFSNLIVAIKNETGQNDENVKVVRKFWSEYNRRHAVNNKKTVQKTRKI